MQRQAVVAGEGDGVEDLQPRRLLDGVAILDHLVIDAAESRLGDRLLRDLLDAIEANLAHRRDALRARLQARLLPDLEGAVGGGDGLVEIVEDARRAAAQVRRRARRLRGLRPLQALDHLVDQLLDLFRRQHLIPLRDRLGAGFSWRVQSPVERSSPESRRLQAPDRRALRFCAEVHIKGYFVYVWRPSCSMASTMAMMVASTGRSLVTRVCRAEEPLA